MRSRSRGNGGIIGRNASFLGSRGLQTLNEYFVDDTSLYGGQFDYHLFMNSPELEYIVGLLPPMVDGDQKFAAVYKVGEGFSSGGDSGSNLVAFGISGDYTVDWGDGTTSSYVSGATAYHSYAYSGITGFTSPHTGNKYVVIQAEVDAGDTFEMFDAAETFYRHPDHPYHVNDITAVRIAGQELRQIHFATGTFSLQAPRNRSLVYIDTVGTNNHIVTQAASGGDNAISLDSNAPQYYDGARFWIGKGGVTAGLARGQHSKNGWMDPRSVHEIGTSTYSTATRYTRNANRIDESSTNSCRVGVIGGRHIKKFVIPDGITNADWTFAYNEEIETIEELVGPDVTSAKNLFYQSSIKRVGTIDFPKCTDFYASFQQCAMLEEVDRIVGSTSGANLNVTFQNCYGLRKVGSLEMVPTSVGSMFGACYQIESVPEMDLSQTTNLTSMFSGCYSLRSIPESFYTTMTAATNASGMFQNCSNLRFARGFSFGNGTSYSNNNVFSGTIASADKIHVSYTTVPTNSYVGLLGLRSNSSFPIKLSEFIVYGNRNNIDVRYANMSADALNLMFTNCGTALTNATISITGNPGSATCNTSIATGKGFTVVN